MEEVMRTFKVVYNPENLTTLRSLFGDFFILKVVQAETENVLIMGFHKGKLIRSAKVPQRSDMYLNTVDEIKTYLLESMIEG